MTKPKINSCLGHVAHRHKGLRSRMYAHTFGEGWVSSLGVDATAASGVRDGGTTVLGFPERFLLGAKTGRPPSLEQPRQRRPVTSEHQPDTGITGDHTSLTPHTSEASRSTSGPRTTTSDRLEADHGPTRLPIIEEMEKRTLITVDEIALIQSVRELGSILNSLRRNSAKLHRIPTYRDIAASTGIPHTTIGTYLTGKVLPPADRLDLLLGALSAPPSLSRALATARDRVDDLRRANLTTPTVADSTNQRFTVPHQEGPAKDEEDRRLATARAAGMEMNRRRFGGLPHHRHDRPNALAPQG